MNHTRHSGIFTVPPHFHVGIVGAGGLGAMTALILAKMGVVRMTVWDDDEVSEVNIPTQLHPVSDVGEYKVVSLQQTLETFSDEILFEGRAQRISPKETAYSQWAFENTHYGLFITAVDSITARQEIWQELTYYKANIDWFLDMRMAAEEFQHFLFSPSDHLARANYETMLFSMNENDIPDVPCTEKATFYCASSAAGHAGKILRDIVRGEARPHRLVHFIADENIAVVNL
jgi:molybdopterin/thiamine biosynthesis adenylyltransferase